MQKTILAAASVLVLALAGCSSPVTPATMVLRNGKVMTMDASRTVAQAVAVYGKKIVFVGTDKDVEKFVGKGTQVVDLQGKTLLPGFIDAHIHPVYGAERLAQCSVDGVSLTVAQIVDYALSTCLPNEVSPAPGKWIQIVNVNPANFVATHTDLDQISTTRPVLLSGIDGHTAWVNTMGLQLANITAATPDPVGGQITRDASGAPTGALKDGGAIALVTAVIPPLSLEERVALTQRAMDLVRSKGITSLQDAWASEGALEIYEAMESSGTLNVRVRATLASEIVDDEGEYQRLAAIRDHFTGHPLVRADAVKIFSDGVIEYPTQTAAMIEPYLDGAGHPTSNFGGRYFSQDVLNRYVTRLDKDGFTVNVHSIGDFTTHAVLDAYQVARDQNGDTDNRHQISHMQIVDPADFSRFAPLGVLPNMQMFWALPDVYSIDALQPYISAERHRYMYPAASLTAAGATIVGGSDWPVDAIPGDPMPNTPLSATQIGMTRTFPAVWGGPTAGQALHPEEDVDLDTMLAAYTINAARALKQEATTGSVEKGKLADLVVLDHDLGATAPEELMAVQVLFTILDGEVVYRPAPAAAPRQVASASPVAARGMAGGVRTLLRSHAVCGHDH
jgi:predicted amidohydrolase YtcJ